jgi:hypothetical protein
MERAGGNDASGPPEVAEREVAQTGADGHAGERPAAAGPSLPARRTVVRHFAVLGGFLLAGIVVTWPQASFLVRGQLPNVRDVASYVWSLWWVAHQIAHLGDPWFTRYMAAPVGIQLGFDTLMPLPGLIMAPVTLLLGPATAFCLLSIVTPALLCYAMYRAARLWLGELGAVAAGAFFGLSSMMAWQNWYHLNICLGSVFLPLTLEAAVRLRRAPGRRPAIGLGLVLGACVLTNQESAVLAVALAAFILVPWLARARRWAAAGYAGLAAGLALVVASPQLIAMLVQSAQGGAAAPPRALAVTDEKFGIGLPTMFSPSPRLDYWPLGLSRLTADYVYSQPKEALATFGLVLTIAALAGLALGWRRPGLRWLGLLWAACAAAALGPTLIIGRTTLIPLALRWHGVLVSGLMPYTWLIRVPGLSALREADRLALLGLVGAAVLAGAAAEWLRWHARPVLAVLAAGWFLEAGWAGTGALMPTTMPAVDRPIAADHSSSIVVDVPFGLRGGILLRGHSFPARALLLATEDGHPRAVSYTSWVPQPTSHGIIVGHAFYRCLGSAQSQWRKCAGAQLTAARQDVRRLGVGWVLVWNAEHPRASVGHYLVRTGFHIAYRADNVTVWRPGQ